MIETKIRGDWSRTTNFLKNMPRKDFTYLLHHYGELGVARLSAMSPKDTGRMASSWSYKITKSKNTYTITWHNSDIEDGCNVAILVQYGHATQNGAFVQGNDFINPALKSVMDDLSAKIWEEVVRA